MSHLKNSELRNDLGHLLKASYLPQKEAKEKLKHHGYNYDNELSKMDTKVLVDKKGNPVILHRGSKTARDWLDDGLLAVGLEKYSKRFQDAKEITKKAEAKYNKPAHSVGHSLGGSIAEKSNNSGNIISYNKGVGLGDIGKKKNSNRQLDVRAEGDIVSLLGHTQKANKETVKNKNYNPLSYIHNAFNAHKTDNLFFNPPDRNNELIPKDYEDTDLNDLSDSPII